MARKARIVVAAPTPADIIQNLEAQLRKHKALALAVGRYLEETDNEEIDIDFLWAAWNRFKGGTACS